MTKKVRYAPFPTYLERFYILSIKYTGKSLVFPIQNFLKVTIVTLVNEINNNSKVHYKLKECFIDKSYQLLIQE